MLERVRSAYGTFLETIVIVLMVALAVEVTIGVVFRYVGYALVWYDEVATILLAWVTYYGSALAALKRAHLGVPELVRMLPPANVKARFFVPQAAIARLPVGADVVLRCDGCAKEIPAKVTYVAAEPEFTPPVIYSNDTRAKLVYLVEARPAALAAAEIKLSLAALQYARHARGGRLDPSQVSRSFDQKPSLVEPKDVLAALGK